jgi:hypothetical protein
MACKCQKCQTIVDGFNCKMVMLRDQLWLSIANKKDILCDSCIEAILGRRLTGDDLKLTKESKPIPVNEMYSEKYGLNYLTCQPK